MDNGNIATSGYAYQPEAQAVLRRMNDRIVSIRTDGVV